MLTWDEIRKHDSRHSCWVVMSGKAYDVTEFLNQHPGGPASILRQAGKDATEEYEPVHPPGTLEKHLPKDKHLGQVEPAAPGSDTPQQAKPTRQGEVPPLSTLQNIDEFEPAAEKVLSKRTWVYFHSATDTLTSHKRNKQDWTRVTLRPRVLRNVGRVDMKTRIMGHDSSLPLFICPAAQARLGHEHGEFCLARGAARHNIPYCMSTYSSIAPKDLSQCLREERKGGALLFQLYVPIDKPNARLLVRDAVKLGFKALVITVDSPVIGKREEDDRYKAELDHVAGIEIPRSLSVEDGAPIARGAHSSTLEWADLPWIRKEWNNTGPVILKGIQTVEDAVMAAEAGVDAIWLSNHGGRQMDYAPSSISTLLEIRKYRPDVLKKVEVYLDGGVSRGSDVVKAIALGARAVGLGRPFMYALSAYGTAGVEKAIEILNDEIQTTMRLLGVTALSQLNDFYVNTTVLENELPRRIDLPERSRL